MAIRLRNLDLQTDGMREHESVVLGDITATRSYQFFIAPKACVVERVDLYSNLSNPVAGATASTSHISATLDAIQNATATVMVSRGTSATAITTDSITANVRWTLTPSSNNSLTQGTPLRLTFTVGTSANLSAVVCEVVYRPLIHRETR